MIPWGDMRGRVMFGAEAGEWRMRAWACDLSLAAVAAAATNQQHLMRTPRPLTPPPLWDPPHPPAQVTPANVAKARASLGLSTADTLEMHSELYRNEVVDILMATDPEPMKIDAAAQARLAKLADVGSPPPSHTLVAPFLILK